MEIDDAEEGSSHQNRSASSSFQDEMNKKTIRSKGPFLLYETTVHKKTCKFFPPKSEQSYI